MNGYWKVRLSAVDETCFQVIHKLEDFPDGMILAGTFLDNDDNVFPGLTIYLGRSAYIEGNHLYGIVKELDTESMIIHLEELFDGAHLYHAKDARETRRKVLTKSYFLEKRPKRIHKAERMLAARPLFQESEVNYDIERIKQAGSEWKKADHHRVYFDYKALEELGIFRITRYNTGSVSGAWLDGIQISNNKGRAYDPGKVWFDLKAKVWRAQSETVVLDKLRDRFKLPEGEEPKVEETENELEVSCEELGGLVEYARTEEYAAKAISKVLADCGIMSPEPGSYLDTARSLKKEADKLEAFLRSYSEIETLGWGSVLTEEAESQIQDKINTLGYIIEALDVATRRWET